MQPIVSDEVKKSHQLLSQANLQYLEYIRQTPAAMNRSSFRQLLQLNDDYLKMQPWPTFIDQAVRDEIETVSNLIFDLIKSIPLRLFDLDPEKISRYYEIPIGLVNYFMSGIDNRESHIRLSADLMGRGDFVYSSAGLQCIEFNVSPNFGGMEVSDSQRAALSVPVIKEFCTRQRLTFTNREVYFQMFRHVIDTARKRITAVEIEEELNIAIASPDFKANEINLLEQYIDGAYQRFLASEYPDLKGRFFVCNYPYFKVNTTEESISYKGHTIHVIQELYKGFVQKDVLSLFKKGRILVLNGPISPLMGNKLAIALLSEGSESGAFNADECQSIKKHIPWTRKVAPGETTYHGKDIRMEEFLLTHREQLVLKPALGYGGYRVFIGADTPEDIWNKVVKDALEKKNWQDIPVSLPITANQWGQLVHLANQMGAWVVQEFVQSRPYLYQSGPHGCCEHEAVWGFIVFGSQYAGGVVRAMPKQQKGAVINVNQGAEISAIFEVDQ
jgi:hypothetical protein